VKDSGVYGSTICGESAFNGTMAGLPKWRSPTVAEMENDVNNHEKKMPPVHPGEILLEDFLKPMGITPYRLARELNVPKTGISAILKGKRSITADTALRLARFFGATAKLWLNLQVSYDLDTEEDRLGGKIEEEVKPMRDVA
jgi:addiction module HigA family antidote